jgi:RHS repeat-associated protein
MNRKSRVYVSLSQVLIFFVIVSASLVASSAQTATPVFSLAAGSYTGTQTITITDSTSGSTIYYTTDGTTPTTASAQYSGPITVNSTETLEAIATAAGYTQSNVATAVYTITPVTGTLTVYLSPPGAQSTTVAGAATETFDALSTGIKTSAYTSTAGIGTYTGNSTDPFAIVAPNVYGGATDSNHTAPTNYFAVGTESGSTNPVYLTLTQPASYFGFWWSAGDEYNSVALYSGSTLYGTFSTADLLTFLNHGSGTITALNGTTYDNSAYFSNPNITSGSNDSAEPFAYVSFVITGATIDKIAFYNTSLSTGFESDNHSAIFSGSTVTIPTTFVSVETLSLSSPQSPTITWGTPAAITYGTALSATQLDATSTVAGAFAYSPAVGTVLTAGTQTLSVAFTPTDTTDYTTATDTVALTVNRATPTITWAMPAPISYGTALSVTQLDATASVAGIFAYSPAAGTVLTAGTQSLSVTFTPTDTTDYNTATATVTLTVTPLVSVSIAPATVTLSSAQTQEFTATVNNTGNTAVTWTINPAGVGAINTAGLYTAPASVATQQTVTVTATSEADTTQSASATVTLSPIQCGPNAYSYQRAIVIDHTKVPNTDQTNFPILISGTYPFLATVASGGRLQNASGYDVVFTSDPVGQNMLDYEIDSYNGATGAAAYWVRIPTLSHTADTTIYMWYGNPNITGSQENKSGVWSNAYSGVWHFGAPSTLSTADSTANANNGINTGVVPATGIIGGAGAFDGSGNTYLDIPSSASFKPATALTVEAWVNMAGTNSWASIVSLGYRADGSWSSPFQAYALEFQGQTLEPAFDVSVNGNLYLVNGSNSIAAGQWTHLVGTYDGANLVAYANGVPVVTSPQTGPIDFGASQDLAIGVRSPYASGSPINGLIDEARISSVARSPDWIATEYNNESSPSTFYTVYPENVGEVIPAAVNLYGSQSQQFMVSGVCIAAVTWSMPAGAPGTLTANGLYTAPNSITGMQTVTVTATSQPSGTMIGSATVTLLTPPALTLIAPVQPPYMTGSSQGFVVTLKNSSGVPNPGVAVTFTVVGPNNNTGSATTDSNGIASYAYIGGNTGNDTIQASAIVNGQQMTSNSVSVTWTGPASANAEGSVTLVHPSIGMSGLCGAFTDNNGTVIEPIAIGAAPTVFVVPTGATQLQLGVVDNRYADNLGTGFVVGVNGAIVTVLPTSMPWNWVAGGLNTTYQYGLLDGTSPVVALTGLTPGAGVSIVYQSGTVAAGLTWPSVNADGDQAYITGVGTNMQGIYFPTLYMTSSSYPVGQPITFNAIVANGSGSRMLNVPVILNVTGANVRQYQETTDSTGTATFTYSGMVAGTDILDAQAYPSGELSLVSSQASVTWDSYTTPPPGGSLTLAPNTVQPLPAGGQQAFTLLATDASGSPVANVVVTLSVSGVDNFQLSATTNSTGQATFLYQNVNPGTAFVVALATIDGTAAFSNTVSVPWTLPPATTTGSNGSGNAISIGISAQNTLTLPSTLQLNGTVTDSSLPAGSTPTIAWSQVSGPGAATFSNPQQAVTTAAFSQAGNYVLELSASDSVNHSSLQWQVTVNPVSGTPQGWVGNPVYGSTVTGVVPVTLAPGISLQSGILTYYPANNSNNVTVLNANITGSGQIGTLDTTVLANGSYWIQLQGTDSAGNSEYSLVRVTVAGNYKPGRVTATVTDLVVPATGLAINIQRTYDSLNASTSGDFGYGWTLGINVNLTVDPAGDVTFTLGGQRRTFYFAPQYNGFLPYYNAAYTPEPGFYGTLTDSAPGCADGFDFLVPDGSLWFCVSGGQYNPPGYIYTDPTGTSYIIGVNGALQSIQDRSGNGLTITANGITSSTGLSVTFVRDSSNRITQITDPQGNIYQYGYDDSGNLATVTYPNTTTPSTYTYDTNHLYLSGTDARSNPLPVTTYYSATDTDPNGLPLNGRLQSVSDALGETTSYAYNLATNTTTITYPPDAGGNVSTATLVYDAYGMLLSSTDPLNNTTTNVYDINHNLISVTDPLGHTTTYTYDQNGNKTSVTYPATATSKNTTSSTLYNQYREPTSTTDELGNVRTFNYDANYNPQSVTDSAGTLASFLFNANSTLAAGAIGFDINANPAQASQFTYDANGNMASRIDALGRSTSYTYNSLGQKLTMTEPTPASLTGTAASTTTYQYDTLGDLTQTAAPLGRTTGSTFDANGNKLSDTDARGNVTTYQYDALNRLVTTTYPSQPATTSTKTYDFRNNVINETDQAGNVTHHAYDLAGRQVSVTRGYGTSNASITTYAYDAAGHKTGETDALGHATAYTYDAAGRLIAIAGVKGNMQYGYDDVGNQISRTDANGNTTQFQYDARKRLVRTIYPDTTTVSNTYDGPGNLASVTDQAGNVVQYTYDAANQLKTVVQVNHPNPSNNTNSYGYDNLGNLTGLTDENLHTTQNSFDLFNEPISEILPGAQTETRNYDTAGNLISLAHFNGVTTSYSYDTLNRLLTRATPGEPTVSFTYTPTGKYATSAVGSYATAYAYDSQDRLTAKATPAGTLSYTYDAAGHVASIASSNANGASVSYTYDELNRLSTVTDNRLGATTTYSYDPASNLATAIYPNGLQSTFTYDQLNRLTALNSSKASYTYQLGPTGNRAQATESTGRTLSWNYDGIYRLTNETISLDPAKINGSVAYGLDPVGNRLTESSTIQGVNSGSFGYNSDDELSTESYDANGNTLASGGKTFTYDSENRLRTMNGGAVGMVYDAFGNRVAKVANGVITRYLVEDDVNPTGYPQVMEEIVGGAVERVYSYGLQRISEDQIVNNAWTVSFYGYDGAGSVRQLTNAVGVVTDSYEYDAFGNKINSTGSTPNNYLYRGEFFDSDLGLYYMRARYMNPLTGRFMSRDPEDGKFTDPKSLHKYLYAGGDPIDGFDPTGLATMTKPQSGVGGALAEYAGVISDISFKIAFYTQFALPAYLASPQGKLVIVKALGLLAAGEVIACWYEDFAESLDPNSKPSSKCEYFDTPDPE